MNARDLPPNLPPSSPPIAPLLPGFDDPVHAAQRVFRALLSALSRPGSLLTLSALPQSPLPLHPAAGAALLALADYETPVWLQTPTAAVADWLRFHCGVALAAEPGDAAFALIDRPLEMPPLTAFAQGQPEYPDRSATLIVQVAGFAPDGLVFSGPGIAGERRLGIAGLAPDFWQDWQAGQAHAPLGVDVLFVAGHRVIGLPRTTTVRSDDRRGG